MKNYVYDHAFNRVTSTLDANNFATWYEYDARGRLVKQAVEIENIGKKIIQKKLYNDQKPVD
jgi:YD repeat-containing protein